METPWKAGRQDRARSRTAPVYASQEDRLVLFVTQKYRHVSARMHALRRAPRREHSAVTAVWCQWDFNADVPKCGFYFGIWSEQDALPNPVDGKFTAFWGFRYETPEEGHNHDYYHAQPCQSMGNREVVAHAVPVSTRYPTFPLAATSSLELLLCFFVSIYAMDG